jgi:DNA integrity scanning protein DisA with diadenylate cyclase activity
MIRKDTLLYKLTQLHWFLLLTIIALATFGTLILFSAGSSAHDLETGGLRIDASFAIAHMWRLCWW